MVDCHRRSHRSWITDEVHDLFLHRWDSWWDVVDPCAPILLERLGLGWPGRGAAHLSPESCLASAAWIYLDPFLAAHPCSRCGPGARQWIFAGSVPHLYESV